MIQDACRVLTLSSIMFALPEVFLTEWLQLILPRDVWHLLDVHGLPSVAEPAALQVFDAPDPLLTFVFGFLVVERDLEADQAVERDSEAPHKPELASLQSMKY